MIAPAPMPKLPKRRKGKYLVALITPPADWRPTRMHSLPPSFDAVEIMARSLKATEAALVAQSYNLAHLQTADYRGRWAVVVSAQFPVVVTGGGQ